MLLKDFALQGSSFFFNINTAHAFAFESWHGKRQVVSQRSAEVAKSAR